MKKHLTYAIAALFATALVASAAPEGEMMGKEKAAWQAYKDKNEEAFTKLAAPEYHSVYDSGIRTLADEMAAMKGFTLNSFVFSDFKSASPDPDTAINTYTVKMDAMSGDEKISGMVNAASVWRKINGEWRVVFHTSVPQKDEKMAVEEKSAEKK